MYFKIVLLCGIIFGMCILTSNFITYANSQSNNNTLDKNNTTTSLSNTANSSKNNNNTTADLSPDLGYHYEYNFY